MKRMREPAAGAVMVSEKRKRPTTRRTVDSGPHLLVALNVMRLAMELLPGTPREFEEFAQDYRELRKQLARRRVRCERLPISRETTRLIRTIKKVERELAELEARSRTFQQGSTA